MSEQKDYSHLLVKMGIPNHLRIAKVIDSGVIALFLAGITEAKSIMHALNDNYGTQEQQDMARFCHNAIIEAVKTREIMPYRIFMPHSGIINNFDEYPTIEFEEVNKYTPIEYVDFEAKNIWQWIYENLYIHLYDNQIDSAIEKIHRPTKGINEVELEQETTPEVKPNQEKLLRENEKQTLLKIIAGLSHIIENSNMKHLKGNTGDLNISSLIDRIYPTIEQVGEDGNHSISVSTITKKLKMAREAYPNLKKLNSPPV